MKIYATMYAMRDAVNTIGKPATKGAQEKLMIELERDQKLFGRVVIDTTHAYFYPVNQNRGGRIRLDE